jgi:hypothetical protein
VNYYAYAVDRIRFGKLKHVMEIALVKTLAHKLRVSVSRVYQRYRAMHILDGTPYRILQETVETPRGLRHYQWGGIPLETTKLHHGRTTDTTGINDDQYHDERHQWSELRSEVVTRLRADRCELCEQVGNCEVHHIRKLADLTPRRTGRREKPLWVHKMIALRRKTLVVCHACHQAIHAGEPLPRGFR